MGHATVIGWAYEADLHCEDCARARFGATLDAPDTEDRDGNPVHPMFSTDEAPAEGEYCGDCGAEISKPWEDLDDDAPEPDGASCKRSRSR